MVHLIYGVLEIPWPWISKLKSKHDHHSQEVFNILILLSTYTIRDMNQWINR